MDFKDKKRLICVDCGAMMFKAIYSKKMIKESGAKFVSPSSYLYFNSILSQLKKIGIRKDDQIFMCIDGRNSWRKIFYPIYKGQRAEQREKQEIDWDKEFALINKRNQELSDSTDWQFLFLSENLEASDLINTEEGKKFITNYDHISWDYNYGVEADDFQAYFAKNYPDKEVVLITCDCDLYQLAHFPNTKIFSLNKKHKGVKGSWADVPDGIKILNDKVRLGDASDNIIVNKENDTEKEVRRFIIDLLSLPKFIEDPISDLLKTLKPKTIREDLLPCQNSLAKKFFDIYKTDKIITFEEAIKYQTKVEAKRKKAISDKGKAKRAEEKKLKELEKQKALR